MACRRRQLSVRTEEAYRFWVRHYLAAQRRNSPPRLDQQSVVAFLNHLVGVRRVSASTQVQALSALQFLYREVLGGEIGELSGLRRIQRLKRMPVVLSQDEVRKTLNAMSGMSRLVAALLYGTGLRVTECITDVPPVLSSAAIWSPIPQSKEIGREEALFRRADHRLPA